MEKTVKLGVFGTWRGNAYIKVVKQIDDAKVVAIYDKSEEQIRKAKENCPEDVKVCGSFEELLDSGIDALLLCNYFPEHAQYAIRALEKGIAVCSETMAASTLGLCVELVRAVEQSGCVYMLAENYPFSRGCMEMRRIYETGKLGPVAFAEGEYVHPMSPSESWKYNNPDVQGKYHWRRFLPATYYSSHAMMPLMYMTGAMPKTVIGKVAKCPEENIRKYRRTRGDAVGVMLVGMDNGAIFRVNGSTYVAPHGNWYRLGCLEGAVETVRGCEKKVRLSYNKWSVPEGEEADTVYEAVWQSDAEKADACGHGGGDYWIIRNFVDAVLAGKPDERLDVYHATAMAAVSILGWRSVLSGSKELQIPDFRNEEDRKRWENDSETPFPEEGKPGTLPYTYYPIPEDLYGELIGEESGLLRAAVEENELCQNKSC